MTLLDPFQNLAFMNSRRIALTAPLEFTERILIGIALSAEESQRLSLSPDEFKQFYSAIFSTRSCKKVFHGLSGIMEQMDHEGLQVDIDKDINIDKIEDVRLMAYLLDPDCSREQDYGDYRVQEELTLANLSSRYLRREYPYRIIDISERPSEELIGEMLAYDAALILELSEKLPEQMSPALRKLCRHLELPLMLVLDRMRRAGIGFDGVRCAELVRQTERSMAELAREITEGNRVDLTSHSAVQEFLVGRGIPLDVARAYVQRRGIRQPLEQIAHAYPVVRKVLAWWEMGVDLGFLRRWAGRTSLHPVWGQTRSATSRVYARSPAVQNISRQLRKLFVPAEGHVLVKADYSQAQLRILAHLSRDPELVRVFQDPAGDVHAETSAWLGLNDRDVAKEINFAICFGMGAAGLCRKINDLKERQGCLDLIDLDTAQRYIDGFYGRFPKVKEFFAVQWDRLKKLPRQERAVHSLLGRQRKFDRRATPETEREFRVTWTQQIEADLIKTAMVRLDRIFRRRSLHARLVMMIHDALWVEAPEEEAEEVRHLIWKMMTTAAKLRVPLRVDLS